MKLKNFFGNLKILIASLIPAENRLQNPQHGMHVLFSDRSRRKNERETKQCTKGRLKISVSDGLNITVSPISAGLG